MIITPKLFPKIMVALVWVIVIGVCIYINSVTFSEFAMFSSLFLLLMQIKVFYIGTRTLIFDKTGCTVKFLCFKKFYPWSKLKTIKVLDYIKRFPIGKSGPAHEKGVFFSAKERIYIPKFLEPLEYASFCLNPAKFFVVNFRLPNDNSEKIYYRYEVDEAEFLAKMEEWGVELTYES